jgi:hypothetical protein
MKAGVAWVASPNEHQQMQLDVAKIQLNQAPSTWDWKVVGADIAPERLEWEFEVWGEGNPAYRWNLKETRDDTIQESVLFPYSGGKRTGFSGYSTHSGGLPEPQYSVFTDFNSMADPFRQLNNDIEANGPHLWWVVNQSNGYDPHFINKFASQPLDGPFESRHGAQIKSPLDNHAEFIRPFANYSMYHYQFDAQVMTNSLLNLQGTLHSTDTGYKMPLSTEPGDIHSGFRYQYKGKFSLLSKPESRPGTRLRFKSQKVDDQDHEYYSVMVAMNVERLQPSIPYYNTITYSNLLGQFSGDIAKQKSTKYYWDSAPYSINSARVQGVNRYVMGGEVKIYGHEPRTLENAVLAEDIYQSTQDEYPIFIWRKTHIPTDQLVTIEEFFELPPNSRVRNRGHYYVAGGGVTYHTGDNVVKTIFTDPSRIGPAELVKNTKHDGTPMIELY